jgi:predicted amidophosphoribosyltransferase
MAVCPNCGNQTGEGAVFCDRCGTRLPEPEAVVPAAAPAPAGGSVICPACGAGNVPGEAFCDFCGSPLAAPVPTAEPVPELEPVSSEAGLVVTPAAPAPAVEGGKPTCPACGVEVAPDEAFCHNCGASLAQPPIAPEPVPEEEAAVAAVEEPAPIAAEPAAAPVEEPAPPPAPAATALTCPVCGAEVEAGDAFCSSCGASLKAAPAPAPAPVEATPVAAEVTAAPPPPPPSPPAAAGPRLVVAASGAEIPLPAKDEILIGREDPVSGVYPDVDMTPHGGEDGGVSRRHARLIVEGGSYFVEDLDSTNFTFVNKQKLAPGTRHPLHSGDEIRCGRVALVLKTG